MTEINRVSPSRQVAAQYRARILDGSLEAGTHMPSARTMATQWEISTSTASAIVKILAAEGLVQTAAGRLTVVLGPPVERGLRKR